MNHNDMDHKDRNLVFFVVFVLFAASLHFLMGPGGMVSFGHAAYLGLGAYAAALLARSLPMEVALIAAPIAAAAGALVCGWFSVRLSGVYLAMLTLAFAQIAWSVVFQWDSVTGGSNGLFGIRPALWLSDRNAYYVLALVVAAAAVASLWRMIFSPFGYALRAARDSPLRASAVGIDVRSVQWQAFVIAGLFAGIAGALYAFSKGSISPEVLAIPRSVDAPPREARSAEWTPEKVRGFLSNEKYTGEYEICGVRYKTSWPPIIGVPTWNACLRVRMGAFKPLRVNRSYRNYLLTGTLRCGRCSRARVGWRRRRHPCW